MMSRNHIFWWRSRVLLLLLPLVACQGIAPVVSTRSTTQPIDPYDYNFCGGKPVYPVIGYTFSTWCGPRNLIALGRTGTLSWLFPPHGEGPVHEGRRELSEKELKHLSLLAEAVQLSGAGELRPADVNYWMGVDFPGRPIYQRFDVLSTAGTPSNRLYYALLAMIPDKPLLPECGPDKPFFDPVSLPGERHALTPDELRRFQERSRAKKK